MKVLIIYGGQFNGLKKEVYQNFKGKLNDLDETERHKLTDVKNLSTNNQNFINNINQIIKN
jgi:hypothetical protein